MCDAGFASLCITDSSPLYNTQPKAGSSSSCLIQLEISHCQQASQILETAADPSRKAWPVRPYDRGDPVGNQLVTF